MTKPTYIVTAVRTNPAIDDGKALDVLYYEGPSLAVAIARMAEAATAYADEFADRGNGKNLTHSVRLSVNYPARA